MNLWSVLARLRKSPDRSVMVEGSTGRPVRDTDGGKLFTQLATGRCPDCGSTAGFLEGPSGGLSTNVFCANDDCQSGFNVTPMIGTAERIR